MDIHGLLAREAYSRGVQAAVADAKLFRTHDGLRALVKRVFDPARQGVLVEHSRLMRDPNNLELTGTVKLSRLVTQDDVDELLGYQSVLTGWLDDLFSTGKITLSE